MLYWLLFTASCWLQFTVLCWLRRGVQPRKPEPVFGAELVGHTIEHFNLEQGAQWLSYIVIEYLASKGMHLLRRAVDRKQVRVAGT